MKSLKSRKEGKLVWKQTMDNEVRHGRSAELLNTVTTGRGTSTGNSMNEGRLGVPSAKLDLFGVVFGRRRCRRSRCSPLLGGRPPLQADDPLALESKSLHVHHQRHNLWWHQPWLVVGCFWLSEQKKKKKFKGKMTESGPDSVIFPLILF